MKHRWKRVGKWARLFLCLSEKTPRYRRDGEQGRDWQIPAGGKVTSAWGSCPSRVEDGAREGPFSLLPRERWVPLKPSIRADFLLFLAAPRPGTDSTINSRKGNWKECPRKRACGRQAGRQQDWTPPGHSPGLSPSTAAHHSKLSPPEK